MRGTLIKTTFYLIVFVGLLTRFVRRLPGLVRMSWYFTVAGPVDVLLTLAVFEEMEDSGRTRDLDCDVSIDT